MGSIDLQTLFSAASLLLTLYFWCVKSRRERPNLEFHQLSHFRVTSRRQRERPGIKRVSLQQLDIGGVLAVNHSTRLTSIVLFDCELDLGAGHGTVKGDWGFAGEDRPPWNVGPESALAISPVCFFDVPEEIELPDNPVFRLRFLTAGGQTFAHVFTRLAPRVQIEDEPVRTAA